MNANVLHPGTVRQLGPCREELHSVGIHRRKTIGKRVLITQHAEVGTSFEFMDEPEPHKEYHVPARLVPGIFQS